MQFEKNLVLLRKKNGLSQDELAFAIGVTRQTIYTWEAGLNYPNIIMLKKLAEILNVSTDDLLNGFEVNKLPNKINPFKLTYAGKHDGEVKYDELPNWFIKLKPNESISWALYDLVKDGYIRDYSYHIEVKGNVLVHDIEGVEIEVKEYKPNLDFNRCYNQYISINDKGIAWIGEMTFEGEKKIFKTYKDQSFLDDWGLGKKLEYQKTKYEDAKDYILELDGKKQKVIKVSYFDPDGSDNPKRAYFEVFLNQELETLIWRRYTLVTMKKNYTNERITIDDNLYDLDYYCVTSRL